MKLVSIAGDSAGTAGYTDDTGPDARFEDPRDLALVGHLLYVCDYDNDAIRTFDLDTSEVATFATLAASPTNISITDGYIWVTTRGAASRLLRLDLGDGSVITEITPPGDPPVTLGSIARFADGSANWWVKGPIGAFRTGWYSFDAAGTLTFDEIDRDGAYASDAAVITAAGNVWKVIDYMYPSGTGFFTTGPPVITSGYSESSVPAFQLAVSPFSETGVTRLVGLSKNTAFAVLTEYAVTETTYEGNQTLDLGFSANGLRGIASDLAAQTLYFSGLNQLWMTDLLGSWHPRIY